MSASPLRSWKQQPPETFEEAATARLLRLVGEAPALSREAAARIRSRVQGGGKGGRGPQARLKRLTPLFFEPRVSVLAAGFAALAILAALVTMILADAPAPKKLSAPAQIVAPLPDRAAAPH